MSNTFFQGGRKLFRGCFSPCASPSFGPDGSHKKNF